MDISTTEAKGKREATEAAETENKQLMDEGNDGDDEEDESCNEDTSKSRARSTVTGRGVTVLMLMEDGMIEPGDGVMTIDYLGRNFTGDLLPDGRIQSEGNIFNSPSAWAIHCKKIVNPAKKSGCGWASVKYKGKKMDSYKSSWFRKQNVVSGGSSGGHASPCHSSAESGGEGGREVISTKNRKMETASGDEQDAPLNLTMAAQDDSRKTSVKHSSLLKRNMGQDMNTLVECVAFGALGKIQPFTISVSSNALLLLDFHCHLTSSEVMGYLGGRWDPSTQHLSVLQTFPCKCRLGDKENAHSIEEEIRLSMDSRGLTVVGWYHSHPKAQADPSVKDIESQMEYQLQLTGAGHQHLPCIGFVCSPYDPLTMKKESTVQAFWVMPPPENKPSEYGMPIQMEYEVSQDVYLSQDILNEMKYLMDFYGPLPDLLDFTKPWYQGQSYIDKLKFSLGKKFPKDQSHDGRFMEFIQSLLTDK